MPLVMHPKSSPLKNPHNNLQHLACQINLGGIKVARLLEDLSCWFLFRGRLIQQSQMMRANINTFAVARHGCPKKRFVWCEPIPPISIHHGKQFPYYESIMEPAVLWSWQMGKRNKMNMDFNELPQPPRCSTTIPLLITFLFEHFKAVFALRACNFSRTRTQASSKGLPQPEPARRKGNTIRLGHNGSHL